MQKTDDVIIINEQDSVAVAARALYKNEEIRINGRSLMVRDNIPVPHKVAVKSIKQNEILYKYASPIGFATQDIAAGEWVHLHNLHSNLEQSFSYEYRPDKAPPAHPLITESLTFQGYPREDGSTGIRNYIFIIPTAFCANGPIMKMAAVADEKFSTTERFDGFLPLCHPCGCGETGDNLVFTQKILSGLAKNPNAAGVLFVGVGCEANDLKSFIPVLGDFDERSMKFMTMQQVDDEIEFAMELLEELHIHALGYKRETVSISKLVVGVNCGGSDGFSGLTANPLVGEVTDILTAQQGTVVMTEVPEMFGAEQILMNRAKDEDVFLAIEKLINDYKAYYKKYGIEVYKNPTQGNNEGGLTTLEEKSLGCTEKGGRAKVTDVLDYGGHVQVPGLNLLEGPGHDLVGITAQIAAGCNLIIFTTGRGTPGGYAAPVLRITTNSDIYRRKKHWADFDAGTLLSGADMEYLTRDLIDLIIQVANGEIRTMTEINHYFEIGILRDGITT
jgi:altronate hydrolase